MSNASEIASLLTQGIAGPTGSEDISVYKGQIVTWDRTSGANTVRVNGVILSNLLAIQSGIPAAYSVGDAVMVFRKATQYFIWGKVAAANAGAGSAPRGETIVNTVALPDTGGAWVDLPGSPGPTLDVWVGSNRAVLVMWSAQVEWLNSYGEVGWAVSGANTLAPGTFASMTAQAGGNNPTTFENTTTWLARNVQTPVAGQYLLGNTVLLNQGLTTFTMKYRSIVLYPGVSTGAWRAGAAPNIGGRSLTVIPL